MYILEWPQDVLPVICAKQSINILILNNNNVDWSLEFLISNLGYNGKNRLIFLSKNWFRFCTMYITPPLTIFLLWVFVDKLLDYDVPYVASVCKLHYITFCYWRCIGFKLLYRVVYQSTEANYMSATTNCHDWFVL